MAGSLTGTGGWSSNRFGGGGVVGGKYGGYNPEANVVTGPTTKPDTGASYTKPSKLDGGPYGGIMAGTGATKANNYNGLGLPPKAGNFKNRPGGLGSPTIPPATPAAPTLPPMPFNFNASAIANAGVGAGGAGGGAGAAPTGTTLAGPPGTDMSQFRGSKSTELSDSFNRANQLYDTAPDLMNNAMLRARDAGTMAARELGNMGTLAGGRTSPAKMAALQDATTRNIADAAKNATKDTWGMRLSALSPAIAAGSGIASDLRGQESNSINAYRATTDAWKAGQDADISRQRMSLDSQLAALQASMGMYNSMMNMYSSMMGAWS